MSFLKELANQLSNLWGTWSRTQQVLMVVSAVVCLASIAGVGVWATRPEYIALVDHLGPGDAAEVVSTLEAAGIDYKLNFSGSAISVPRQSVSRARLALKDVIDTESTQDESLDGRASGPTRDSVMSGSCGNRNRACRGPSPRCERSATQLCTSASRNRLPSCVTASRRRPASCSI